MWRGRTKTDIKNGDLGHKRKEEEETAALPISAILGRICIARSCTKMSLPLWIRFRKSGCAHKTSKRGSSPVEVYPRGSLLPRNEEQRRTISMTQYIPATPIEKIVVLYLAILKAITVLLIITMFCACFVCC